MSPGGSQASAGEGLSPCNIGKGVPFQGWQPCQHTRSLTACCQHTRYMLQVGT